VLAMTDYWSATDWDLVEYKAVTRFLTEGSTGFAHPQMRVAPASW